MKKSQKKYEAGKDVMGLNTVDIFGVRVVSTQRNEVISLLSGIMNKKTYMKPFIVVTVNQEFVMGAQRDEEFRQILNSADLALPDGVGLKLANSAIAEIIPGRKVVEELLAEKPRVFFLGGMPGVAEDMARIYGGGWDEGEKNIRSGEVETRRIINKVNNFRPDLLLVAYGAPWQEKWIWRHKDEIKAKVMMGVGGTFDVLTGRKKAPPEWVRRAGGEWLWRLVQEPWRWRRQLDLMRFTSKAFLERLKK